MPCCTTLLAGAHLPPPAAHGLVRALTHTRVRATLYYSSPWVPRALPTASSVLLGIRTTVKVISSKTSCCTRSWRLVSCRVAPSCFITIRGTTAVESPARGCHSCSDNAWCGCRACVHSVHTHCAAELTWTLACTPPVATTTCRQRRAQMQDLPSKLHGRSRYS